MEGILLPICSLFFSGLMCYVYFSKERVDLLENKMYSSMIICSFVDSLIVTILQSIAFFYSPGYLDFIITILNKIDFVMLVIICNHEDSISALEEKLQHNLSTMDYYDSDIEKHSDYRPKDKVRPEDVFENIANIENINVNNVNDVVYAQKLVRQRKREDIQRRF